MPSIRPSRRLAALLLAGACTPALLAPAAASAIAIPAIPRGPKIQTTDFRVSLVARQTTTWRESPAAGAADCTEMWSSRGEGKETVTMRTRKPFVLTGWRTGRRVEFMPKVTGQSSIMEPVVAAQTNRSANVTLDVMGCGDDGDRVERGGPYDCGPRSFDRVARLEITWSRMLLDLSGEPMLAPLVRTGYDTCPIYASRHVATNGITRIGQSFPAEDLFAPDMRKHVVLASRSFRLRDGRFSGSTTVRWEMTLVRTRAINRIGI